MTVKGKHKQKSLSAMFVCTVSNASRYGDGSGLYLIVAAPSGAKRWVLRAVVMGKRRDMAYLLLVSFAEACEEAIRLRKIARWKGDPIEERRKEQRAV